MNTHEYSFSGCFSNVLACSTSRAGLMIDCAGENSMLEFAGHLVGVFEIRGNDYHRYELIKPPEFMSSLKGQYDDFAKKSKENTTQVKNLLMHASGVTFEDLGGNSMDII